jgi:hypothetical protein
MGANPENTGNGCPVAIVGASSCPAKALATADTRDVRDRIVEQSGSGETPFPLYACLPRSRAVYGAGFSHSHANPCGCVQSQSGSPPSTAYRPLPTVYRPPLRLAPRLQSCINALCVPATWPPSCPPPASPLRLARHSRKLGEQWRWSLNELRVHAKNQSSYD